MHDFISPQPTYLSNQAKTFLHPSVACAVVHVELVGLVVLLENLFGLRHFLGRRAGHRRRTDGGSARVPGRSRPADPRTWRSSCPSRPRGPRRALAIERLLAVPESVNRVLTRGSVPAARVWADATSFASTPSEPSPSARAERLGPKRWDGGAAGHRVGSRVLAAAEQRLCPRGLCPNPIAENSCRQR